MGWKRNRLQAMMDQDLANVHLVGTDGEEIACNKAFLAAASPVFKRMFFRGFREQTQDRCHLNYHSMVLTMVVKHCYCNGGGNNVLLVDLSHILDGSKSLEEEAEILVSLYDASRYFELNQMHSDLEEQIDKLIFKQGKYRYTWALLTGLLNHHGEADGALWTRLVEFVVENPRLCSLEITSNTSDNGGIPTYHPNPDILLEILKRSKDTLLVIKCLQTWFTREKELPGGGSAKTKQALVEIARDEVDLTQLDIFALSKIESSLLFPMQKIEQAVEHHRTDNNNKSHERGGRSGKVKFYCIFGCSMRRLNGKYKPLNDSVDTRIFYKNEVYQGRTCMFVLHCKPLDDDDDEQNNKKWLLSMTREKYDVLSRTRTVAPSQCGVHFYQAPAAADFLVVPYNGWECVEASGKSPIVAPVCEEDL